MAVRCGYRFGAEIWSGSGGAPLASVRVGNPDWGAAVQWSWFEAIRSGAMSATAGFADGVVEPVWDGELGRPFIAGVSVRPGLSPKAPATEIPSRYLRPDVEAAAARLVEEGRLAKGELFRFRLYAMPEEAGRLPSGRDRFPGVATESIPQPLRLEARPLTEALEGSRLCDAAEADPVDMPVFIPAAVVDGLAHSAAVAGQVEAGGVLVGVRCRDPGDGALFLEVDAFLPCRGVGTADRFTFTPEAWAEAHAAVALRGGPAGLVGWGHSHVFACGACPPEAQRRCGLTKPFMSVHDVFLHRTVFGRAFDVAVLLTDRGPFGREFGVFGWRRGLLERRAYHLAGVPAHPDLAGGVVAARASVPVTGAEPAGASPDPREFDPTPCGDGHAGDSNE